MTVNYRLNEYYDNAYNTRIGVDDDVDQLFITWAEKSTQAQTTLPCQLAIPYGDGNRETIDLFFAENTSNKWLVFIHGGYWRVMTSAHFHFLAEPFIKAGWNVAFPEYDLCPAVDIHTIVNQCQRAIAWLANEYSDSCDEILITGHSAGGHLTGMMFATDWDSISMSSELIKGGIALSALFDLDPLAQTAMNDDLKLTIDDVQVLSPARLLPQVDAPLVLAVGAIESAEFQRQNTILRGNSAWQSITSDTLSLDGIHHYNILDEFTTLSSPMWVTLQQMGVSLSQQ